MTREYRMKPKPVAAPKTASELFDLPTGKVDLTPAPVANIVPAVSEEDVMKYWALKRKQAEVAAEIEVLGDKIKANVPTGATRIGSFEVNINEVHPKPSVDWEKYFVDKNGMGKAEVINYFSTTEGLGIYLKAKKPYRQIESVQKV